MNTIYTGSRALLVSNEAWTGVVRLLKQAGLMVGEAPSHADMPTYLLHFAPRPQRHPATETPTPGDVRLTDREKQVLQGMSLGRANREIGAGLYLTEDTVKSHCRKLYRKLGVADRAHAVARGYQLGLLGGER